MSQPYIQGEALHKAFWPRGGSLRMLEGKVIMANEFCFFVEWQGGAENMTQGNLEGWRRTKLEALDDLLDRLAVAAKHLEHDKLRLEARQVAVKNLRGQISQLEA